MPAVSAKKKPSTAPSPETIERRTSIMCRAFDQQIDSDRVEVQGGYMRPIGLLLHLIALQRGPRTSVKQAIKKLARKPADYGAEGGELGAPMLHTWRRARLLWWVPPGYRHRAENRLTIERLVDILETDPGGGSLPAWAGYRYYTDINHYGNQEELLLALWGRRG